MLAEDVLPFFFFFFLKGWLSFKATSAQAVSFRFWFFYEFIFLLFYYLFLAVLGLCCCARGFSSCGERGLLFLAMRGPPIVVGSVIVEHGL